MVLGGASILLSFFSTMGALLSLIKFIILHYAHEVKVLEHPHAYMLTLDLVN